MLPERRGSGVALALPVESKGCVCTVARSNDAPVPGKGYSGGVDEYAARQLARGPVGAGVDGSLAQAGGPGRCERRFERVLLADKTTCIPSKVLFGGVYSESCAFWWNGQGLVGLTFLSGA